ncbi:aldo/keto reductase [Bauldia sp.]|uniref:aldo/keto reductase n=1 Tax=Bauldia sp. TaxID=2575872 RepID=UPI003BABDB00
MTTITLWDGAAIPRLGMGCWAIGGRFHAGGQELGWGEVDDGESIAAIRRAVDLGVRYFDTADAYGTGHSEEILAKALGGVSEPIVVSTKFGNTFDRANRELTGPSAEPAYVRQAIDGSLARLKRDRLDLVFFHLNSYPVADARPVFDTLAELRVAGKIDAFGWSNDEVDGARAFADMNGFVSVQYDMNLFRPAEAMSRFIEEENLIGVARQPLAMGLLSGRFGRGGGGFSTTDIRAAGPEWLTYFVDGQPSPALLAKIDAIRDLITSDGRTVVQGALGWIWAKSPRVIPIPGFRTVAQVEENVAALEKGPLPESVVTEIDAVLAQPAAA